MNKKKISEVRMIVDQILQSLSDLGYMEDVDDEVMEKVQEMDTIANGLIERLHQMSPRQTMLQKLSATYTYQVTEDRLEIFKNDDSIFVGHGEIAITMSQELEKRDEAHKQAYLRQYDF